MPSEPAAVLLDGWCDPSAAYAAGPAASPHSFWLDAGPGAETGWSWVGEGRPEPDLDAVRGVVLAGETPEHWRAGPFRGGWIGWLAYEHGARSAGAPSSADDAHDVFVRVDRMLAFDHTTRRVWAIAPTDELDAFAAVARTWTAAPPPVPQPVAPSRAQARCTPEQYASRIERCREAIRDGDAYQLCLTTRFDVPGEHDPLTAFLRLRAATPAHHGGLLRSGSDALVSASPERFLEVVDGTVRTHPIKGTRPRGADAAHDAALADELRTSVKERAENVMIVDLMRNDLSRVCEPSSVAVDRLFAIESYPAVHQLVSTVSGALRDGTTLGGLLDAAFPAGSMTGAPKLSAMTILHDLEAEPRGVFAGCFGWVGTDGGVDLAMVIRSIVIRPAGAYVGAGGGITWRSDAAAEVAEVGVKARGPLAALGAALPAGW